MGPQPVRGLLPSLVRREGFEGCVSNRRYDNNFSLVRTLLPFVYPRLPRLHLHCIIGFHVPLLATSYPLIAVISFPLSTPVFNSLFFPFHHRVNISIMNNDPSSTISIMTMITNDPLFLSIDACSTSIRTKGPDLYLPTNSTHFPSCSRLFQQLASLVDISMLSA